MAKMRSENVEYAKARRNYLEKKLDSEMDISPSGFVSSSVPRFVRTEQDVRQALAERRKALRDLPEAENKLDRTSEETGYSGPHYAENSDSIDRLSRSPTTDEEGNMKYRKGGMVKKKKMAGGGMVRGAGCATKGKGKMRMF